jgi:hypothetical protein
MQYSWNSDGDDFKHDVDAGSAIDIHTNTGNVDLYENDDSITVVLQDACQGYMYPKKYFKLLESPQFERQVKQLELKIERQVKQFELKVKLFALEEKKYPKELYRSIKKAIIEAHNN